MDAHCPSKMEAIADEAGTPGQSMRRLRVRHDCARLSITSDLRASEPVTEAEIKLIMAVIGDTIVQILNPGATE